MISRAFEKSYHGRTVLSMPERDWKPNVIYAVIGANGSGKSTLAKILSGTESADEGVKVLNGVSVGYLPQKAYAFRMSVEDNLRVNGKDSDRASHLLSSLGLLELRKKRAHRLSGGETAKLALARLLMRDYQLLILDEPSAAMDLESTLAAETLIAEYRDRIGCAVILITHNLQQARRMADRILFFDQGECVEENDAEQLLLHPAISQTKRFLQFFGIV